MTDPHFWKTALRTSLTFGMSLWASALAFGGVADRNPLEVANYKVKIERCHSERGPVISLREFVRTKNKFRWVIDETHMLTQLVSSSSLNNCDPLTLNTKPSSTASPYIRAIHTYNQLPLNVQSHGLRKGVESLVGSYLTVDLCPAKGPLVRTFFEQAQSQKWPLTISVSGLWILKHRSDWLWLQSTLSESSVTWVNHSRNHPFYQDRPPEKNFLLSEGRNIEKEILDNEKLLFEEGITPSIFFRFPGLMVNAEALATTQKLGLIPLGANAWLSKGQKPRQGSFILVHGNGNDPLGIQRFEQFLRQGALALPFLDLQEVLPLWAKQKEIILHTQPNPTTPIYKQTSMVPQLKHQTR